MDWDGGSKVVGAVATAVASIAGLVRLSGGRGARRALVERDLAILNQLPEGAEVRPVLQGHIETEIHRMIVDQNEKSRDPSGIVLALLLLGGATWTGWLALKAGGSDFWLFGAVPMAVLGLFGLSRDAVPRRRDERGRPTDQT